MKLPDFLIIGAMKAGTTTLYRDLLTNPAVAMPTRKEPHTLCDDAVLSDAGKADYAALFASARPEQICGEASTGYTKLPIRTGVPERAMQVLGPKLKLIYIMREPVSRIISHHHHLYANGTVGMDINEAVRSCPDLLNFSRYAMQIQPWIEMFGREQILLLQFEQFVSDRHGAAEKVCAFLGIEARPELIAADKVFNKGENKPIGKGIWRAIARHRAYRCFLHPLLPLSLKDRIREYALPKAPARPDPPNDATIAWIRSELADDMEQLRGLMGRQTPIWPEGGDSAGRVQRHVAV
jgi:hypothetical protein